MSILHQIQTANPFNVSKRDHERPIASDHVLVLVCQLDTSWTLIDVETDPAKKARLEDHWIHVLRDYEAACDAEVSP